MGGDEGAGEGEVRSGLGELTDILSHSIGVFGPIREGLDQTAQHGWHAIDGFRVVIEEDLELQTSA